MGLINYYNVLYVASLKSALILEIDQLVDIHMSKMSENIKHSPTATVFFHVCVYLNGNAKICSSIKLEGGLYIISLF